MKVFEPVARTILILEDDRAFQKILSAHARVAVRSLKKKGLYVELTILNAETTRKALQIIEEYEKSIDLLSIDVNLNADDIPDDIVTSLGKPYGGFDLLEQLKTSVLSQTLSLIVSGEKNFSNPIVAFQRYGVLNYIFKGSPEKDEMYIFSIQTAFWYQTALESITRQLAEMEQIDIERAEIAWQNMLACADVAKIRVNQLPQNLAITIEQFRNKYIHPDTRLPMGEWSYAKLRRFIVHSPEWIEHEPPREPELAEWTIQRYRLVGYGEFIQQYASQKQSLMHIFGKALSSVLRKYSKYCVFAGHLDHDLAQSEPGIIVILNVINARLQAEIKQQVQQAFNQHLPQIFPSPDLPGNLQSDDLELSLQVTQWLSTDSHYDFADLHAVIDELNRNYNE